MKAIFIYDHDFITQNDSVFSSGAFKSNSWDRYLEHFDTLTVVGQNVDSNKNLSNLNQVNRENVSFKFLHSIKSIGRLFNNLLSINKELKKEIAQHDGVIVRMYSEWAFQAIRIAKKLDKPYAIELVGCPWDAYIAHHSLKAKILAPFSYFRLRKAIRNSAFVLYVTEKFLQKRYPTEGIQIGASNVMLIEPKSSVLSSRLEKIKNINLKVNPLNIGVIGKIDVKAKGMGVLIKALGQLNINFKLHIVGPGDQDFLKPTIEKYELEDSIVFHGKLMAGEQINDFLDSLDLYIHPSMQEGLPRSVIEAMARACPILASSIAGTPELIDKEYLHQPGNHKQLSKQILYIYNNLHELKEMSMNNFERAKNYYPERLVEKRKDFWGEFYEYVKGQS